MAVADAVTARGMSQRISRAIPAINQNFCKQNALLYKCMKDNKIGWGGSHTEFEWYIRKETAAVPTWGGGELGIRTFEEIDPVNRAHLPYCWIEKTYGVGDRSIEANKNARGSQKIYDILKENLNVAKINLFDAVVPSMWTGCSDGDGSGDEPVGLDKVIGEAYQSTHDMATAAATSYANISMAAAAITGAYATAKANWRTPQWAPIVFNLQETPTVTDGSSVWKTDCLLALSYLAEEMEVTQNLSGTGKPIKPDLAFMAAAAFYMVKAKIVTAQAVGYQIPLGSKSLTFGGFANVVVDSLTCIKDLNVPADTNDIPRVFAIDSSEYKIETTHTKSEGLIINEFSTDNPLVSGPIGVLKVNLGFRVSSPSAVGVIVGAD